VKVRKIWRVKLSKIAIFDDPTLIWRPSPTNPCEYPHKPYYRNCDPWATFSSLIVWVIQIFVVGSERHVCNATERIIAVHGQYMVIQGRWFWYQSKARMRFPISDQLQPWSYLAPFRRYGGLLVEKSPKSPVCTQPSLRNRPRSGWPLSNFVMNQIFFRN